MRDPYFYDDCDILNNKLGLRSQKLLDDAEADYVAFRLKDIAQNPLCGSYDSVHLFEMHRFLFQDLYTWAGEPRRIQIYKEEHVLGGMSIEYSEPKDIVSDCSKILNEMKSKEWNSFDRKSLSLEFTQSLAALWKVHPFREGNTRTTITFCCQFAEEIGIKINRKLFEEYSQYVRTALVAYNAYFNDGSNFAKREYLERLVFDAVNIP